jgi:adenylate cyclase
MDAWQAGELIFLSGKTHSVSIKASLFTAFIIGIFAVLLTFLNPLGNIERSALDLRFSLRGEVAPAEEVLIVGITEQCLSEMGRWPWDRQVHAQLLDVLREGGASVVGLDIIFSEPSPQTWMDDALVEATRKTSNVVYSIDAPPVKSEIPGLLKPLRLTLPLPGLMEAASAGYINVTPDIDGILRRAIMVMEHQEEPIASFNVLAWALWNNMDADIINYYLREPFEPGRNELTLGENSYPLDGGGRTLINYSGGPNNIPVLPYHLVLEGAYPPSTYDGKIILVGYFAPGLGDYYFTPFFKDRPMYGVEVHANIIHMLIQAGPIFSLPLWVNLLLVFTLAFITLFIYRKLHPLAGFIALVVLAAVFYFITMRLFTGNSLYVESVYPLLAMVISYVSSLGYRFIIEQRDRQKVTRLFGRYVAPQVVDEILSIGEDNLMLGGTRRRITLLFIDIRGFTPLSEKLSPEEVVAVLNQYFEMVTRCVFENKGTIDKFMGDAAMALFNAPLLLEDHALWALRAARDITDEGVALKKKVKEMSGVDLNFGIGINTGDAVVGNIGSMNRMEYTAIGDTVNLAARLESNAKPGQILVSESVYLEVGGRMPLEQVGEISVKGKSKPIMVYELARESAQ